MKKVLVPAGWTFEITSWENDGDHYNTKRFTVPTREAANAIKNLLTLFKEDDKVGNVYDPNEYELSYIAEAFMRWAHAHESYFSTISKKSIHEYDEDMILDLVNSVLGHKLGIAGVSEFYTRAVESFKVFYTDEDIIVDEVTEDFK